MRTKEIGKEMSGQGIGIISIGSHLLLSKNTDHRMGKKKKKKDLQKRPRGV